MAGAAPTAKLTASEFVRRVEMRGGEEDVVALLPGVGRKEDGRYILGAACRCGYAVLAGRVARAFGLHLDLDEVSLLLRNAFDTQTLTPVLDELCGPGRTSAAAMRTMLAHRPEAVTYLKDRSAGDLARYAKECGLVTDLLAKQRPQEAKIVLELTSAEMSELERINAYRALVFGLMTGCAQPFGAGECPMDVLEAYRPQLGISDDEWDELVAKVEADPLTYCPVSEFLLTTKT